MLVRSRSPTPAALPPQVAVRVRGASLRSGRGKPVDQGVQPLPLRYFTVGEFRRIGLSFRSAIGFVAHLMIGPIVFRGGVMSPSAISIPPEQCAVLAPKSSCP